MCMSKINFYDALRYTSCNGVPEVAASGYDAEIGHKYHIYLGLKYITKPINGTVKL